MKRYLLASVLLMITMLMFPMLTFAQGICGYNTIAANSEATNNVIIFDQCTASVSGTVSGASTYYSPGAAETIGMAIYDSDGTTGAPKTLLCSTIQAVGNLGTQWYTLPYPSGSGGSWTTCPSIIGGHVYYIAITNSFDTVFHENSGGHRYYLVNSCCSFPSSPTSFSGGPDTNLYSSYFSITPSGTTSSGGFIFAVGP